MNSQMTVRCLSIPYAVDVDGNVATSSSMTDPSLPVSVGDYTINDMNIVSVTEVRNGAITFNGV